ncbi:hypothetical protein NDU88_000665 [Pleurodeles waltl]|uniref:Uncharacterized protein n=1 Tax=Pleurodeles waltl TaxID=8319 RepID=A0AAV7N8K0_PLEWA|nr:hypothetical protein NDU88_000665 [Pleurodeles waltl]
MEAGVVAFAVDTLDDETVVTVVIDVLVVDDAIAGALIDDLHLIIDGGPRVRDLDSRHNCERSRTWSARLVPATVGRSPPGRGFQRGEGPLASPRNSKFSLRCERRWTRVARLAPAAADRATSGRGFQQWRGRTPLPATGQTAPPASRPRTALGAQSRLPVVRRREPTLREQAAQTSTLGRINPAGPSGAGKLGVRHAPDPGHDPFCAEVRPEIEQNNNLERAAKIRDLPHPRVKTLQPLNISS